MSSGGSLVRLSPEGEGEFVGFAWESARSFDTFENTVSPSVSGVEELVIVSGTGPYARGASVVSIDLYDGASWVTVWSASLGAEAYYSLGGLSVRFASQSVSGVRVRSVHGGTCSQEHQRGHEQFESMTRHTCRCICVEDHAVNSCLLRHARHTCTIFHLRAG